MKVTFLLFLVLTSAVELAQAADIYRCEGIAGEVLFSQLPCGKGAEQVTPGQATWVDGAQMKQRSLQQLKRMQQIPSPTRPTTAPLQDAYLGYADRALLKRLKMEAAGMRRDLRRAGPKRTRELTEKLEGHENRIKALSR